MKSKTIRVHSPLDMHLHLREGEMLNLVAPLSSESFAGAMIMPNLNEPVTTEELLAKYTEDVKNALVHPFTPYMTLFFRDDYTYDFLKSIKDKILAIKLYPAGMTTNSDMGVSDLDSIMPVLEIMNDLGIVLSVHGEAEGFVLDRESNFMPIYENIASTFPDLKVIMEHITTERALNILEQYDNLYATVTLHHLMITLDDLAGGMLHPHLFCKPIAKRPEDRDALLRAALGANPKLMFGSDSAPHPKSKKESCGCAAGIFTAPIALQALAGLFEKHHSLDNLQAFVSDNARRIYEIEPEPKTITLKKEKFIVPERYGEVIPMFAGESLEWSIA